MAYYNNQCGYDPLSDRFYESIEDILNNRIEELKRDITPNIKNSAILLQEALNILGKPKDEIVEYTINDDSPNTFQMSHIFKTLKEILDNKDYCLKLDSSKYNPFYLAWMHDYNFKLKHYLKKYPEYYL